MSSAGCLNFRVIHSTVQSIHSPLTKAEHMFSLWLPSVRPQGLRAECLAVHTLVRSSEARVALKGRPNSMAAAGDALPEQKVPKRPLIRMGSPNCDSDGQDVKEVKT